MTAAVDVVTNSAPLPDPGGPEPWEQTRADDAGWLDDIRRDFPLIGVIRGVPYHPGLWTAVWGRGWQIYAWSAVDLYGQLRELERRRELPYQRRQGSGRAPRSSADSLAWRPGA